MDEELSRRFTPMTVRCRARSNLLVQAMKVTDFYDAFWRRVDQRVSDPRTLQRAEMGLRLLSKRDGILLDVGCGTGIATLFFKGKGFQAEGLDVSSEGVRISREKGVEANVLDITRDELKGEYDVIVSFELLEHLVDPLGALEKRRGILGNDGEMMVPLHSDFHLVRRLEILLGLGRFGGYDPSHLMFFNLREAGRPVQEAGPKVEELRSVSLIPPRMKMLTRMCDCLARAWRGLFCISYVLRLTSYVST